MQQLDYNNGIAVFFYVVRAEKLYGGQGSSLLEARVEAGSYTSTVALQVVGGDEKGTQCLGV
jgi:hypothetical protein